MYGPPVRGHTKFLKQTEPLGVFLSPLHRTGKVDGVYIRLLGKIALFSVVLAVFAWPVHHTVTAIVPLGGESPKYVSAPASTPPPIQTVTAIVPAPTPTAAPTPEPRPTVRVTYATPVDDAVLTPTPRPTPTSNRGTESLRSIPDPDENTPAGYPGGSPLSAKLIEEWTIFYTNEERVRAGLRPFDHDSAISDIARAHSQSMVDTGIYGHVIGGHDPTDRGMAAGYDCRRYYADGSYTYGLSENIYEYPRVHGWTGWGTGAVTSWRPTNYDRNEDEAARGMVLGWMNSPGHRANMLDPDARKIGVGVAVKLSEEHGYVLETYFATQNFSACE